MNEALLAVWIELPAHSSQKNPGVLRATNFEPVLFLLLCF